MKKLFLHFVFFLSFQMNGNGQTPVDTSIRSYANTSRTIEIRVIDNLYFTGKIWGFLKYYHPQIASGKVDWDKELIEFLPTIVRTKSNEERSVALENWIEKFGEVPLCDSCNDSLLKDAKLKPDFAWMNEKNFSKSLVKKLLFIQQNRIQTSQYYLNLMSDGKANLLVAKHEPGYNHLEFPTDSYGLLSLFKFWNYVEYWYPYKYDLPISWDNILKQFIPRMLAYKNESEYMHLVAALVTSIHDSHGYISTAKPNLIAGKYLMPFVVKIVENQLVVTSIINDSLASLSQIKKGEIISEIDHIAVNDWIKKYEPYCPASNEWSLKNKLSYWLTQSFNQQCEVTIQRNGKWETIPVNNFVPNPFAMPAVNPAYFPYEKDTAFSIINGNIGYINIGKFNRKDSISLGEMIAKTKSLIIDIRQNQDEQKGTGGADIVGKFILPLNHSDFAKYSTAQPGYPGVFTMIDAANGEEMGSADYYKGNILLLVNENTWSVGEIVTMIFQNAPNVKVMGTTTTGADGNVTYIILPNGIIAQITGLGVYYPNGKETQRVGIKPDIFVKQTLAGYQNNVDEQLNKAIEYLSAPKENNLSMLFPSIDFTILSKGK